MGLGLRGLFGRKTPAPGISVVMAVYNNQDHLALSMDSLLAQTLDPAKFEIIAVDDCSTDSSGAMLDDYAAKHPGLIRVIHRDQPSGHCSEPRNDGIDLARGDYLFFWDGDDYLFPEALQRMLGHAREWGSDILAIRESHHYPDGRDRFLNSYIADNRPSIPKARSRYGWEFLEHCDARRLFRRSLVVKHRIRFQNTLYEDYLFNIQMMGVSDTVSLANDYLYAWYMQWGEGTISSVGHGGFAKTFEGRLAGIAGALESIEQRGHVQLAFPGVYRKVFEQMVYRLITTAMDQRDWSAELPLMPRLRQTLLPYWDQEVAYQLRFTQCAVISALMAGEYDLMPFLRYACKQGVSKSPACKVSSDMDLNSEAVQAVVPQLEFLPEPLRRGLVRRQLSTLEAHDLVVGDGMIRGRISMRYAVAPITDVRLVAEDGEGNATKLKCSLRQETVALPRITTGDDIPGQAAAAHDVLFQAPLGDLDPASVHVSTCFVSIGSIKATLAN